ncbi:MAG: hypothetical protein C0448_08195 [Sphingobacteriaceae bacterium]|nr:hypothetical protein [Sphingobacteriaceae bacterium]
MSWIDEIRNFLEDYSGVYPNSPDTDIFKDMGIVGDDFHEMIEEYSKKYQVDMSDYLWYFHANEEGESIGGSFFKPPYERVKRIPVTPQMLADFILTKKWKVEYPKHDIPKQRTDLLINKAIIIAVIIGIAVLLVYKLTR